jgi:hypothetical protein
MGSKRTFMTWLIASILTLAPQTIRGEDVGPGQEVRTIRHDLPIILARFVGKTGYDPSTLVVDDVAVNGDYALAQWHTSMLVGVDGLVRLYGTWWDRMREYPIPNPVYEVCYQPLCKDFVTRGLTDEDLLAKGFPQTLIQLAKTHIPAVGTPGQAWTGEIHDPSVFSLHPNIDNSFNPDGYELAVRFAMANAFSDSRFQATGRRPTRGESWVTPNNNGYFFFSMMLKSHAAIRVDAGTKLDVWFPFALDPSKTYSLTIAHATPIIGPINGTLSDNTLHFVLPAFGVAPGAELMGEIDGDPPQ